MDPGRDCLTLSGKAAITARDRFNGVRPANLDNQVFTEGDDLRKEVVKLFDRLEGKLDAEAVARLRVAFDQSVGIWKEAGLFTEAREAKGYGKPDFERDFQPGLTTDILDMMEAGADSDLNRGYDSPVFAPKDVPLHSENAEALSYFKLLKAALLEAFRGTAGGKEQNTLLIGPEKRVLTAGEVDLNSILWQWERYANPGVMHNVKKLDPQNHGGVSEEELLGQLAGVEKRTGGILRLERDKLIMPADVGEREMSALDWERKLPSVFPENVTTQDLKQAIAFAIHCLKTQGWIPDFYDYDHPENSRIALAPKTYIPPGKNERGVGVVATLDWRVLRGRFYVGARRAGCQFSLCGVRGGVRI